MYIRWKRRARVSKYTAIYRFGNQYRPKIADTLLSAYLVKSVRIDGEPRQETRYLASIRESQLDYATHRLHFWEDVQAKITPLNLPIEQQRTLKEKLLERVPDVTREQLEAVAKELNCSVNTLKSYL